MGKRCIGRCEGIKERRGTKLFRPKELWRKKQNLAILFQVLEKEPGIYWICL